MNGQSLFDAMSKVFHFLCDRLPILVLSFPVYIVVLCSQNAWYEQFWENTVQGLRQPLNLTDQHMPYILQHPEQAWACFLPQKGFD